VILSGLLIKKYSGFPLLQSCAAYVGKIFGGKMKTDGTYSENSISVEQKLYELSLLWMEAKYNFAFFDQIPELNWDECYQMFIPQVINTKSDWEHYLVLARFYTCLKDGHTRIFPPTELRNKYYGTAIKQIETRLIEGKIIVTNVINSSPLTEGLKAGMEIVAIDGQDSHEYAEKHVAPYAFSSTSHHRDLEIYGYFLLSGPVSKSVTIQVKGFDNNINSYQIPREPWLMEEEVFKGEPLSFKQLSNNLGYLKIFNFVDTPEFRPKFDAIYAKILETDGLIIDVRENFGGATQITHYVLKHLTKSSFKTVTWKSPKNIGAHKAWGQNETWHVEEGYEIEPFRDRSIYEKPVNVIADESSFSGAEDFCLGFITIGRGKLIGRKTAGSTGSPIMFNLPGGALALVCTKKDLFPDGKEFIGFGIQPEIEVETTIKDIIDNRDAALEIAINDILLK
jgi:C-terminal processing protease CtpA/Prc